MVRLSSSSSPDWDKPTPPERNRSGSHQNQGTKWQAKRANQDTQETEETWEKCGWNDCQSQSWEEEGWQRKDKGWYDDWEERPWRNSDQDAWSESSQPKQNREGAPGSSTTSGSYIQRQRLAQLREHNPPKMSRRPRSNTLKPLGLQGSKGSREGSRRQWPKKI